MSRLLAAIFLGALLCSSIANAQRRSDAEIAAMIEKQRRVVALDADGCPKYREDPDEIFVCGPPKENARQKLPFREIDNDRIRRGEAISTERAAARDNRFCQKIGTGLGCIKLPTNSVGGFGSVPPPAIPFAEVLEGLPDQELVDSARDAAPE